MKLLFLEIWVYLLVSFLLGMFVQWFFCCRGKQSSYAKADKAIKDVSPVANRESDSAPQNDEKPHTSLTGSQPIALASAPAAIDELKRIKGIGAVIEQTLNDLGVYTFEQISTWDESNIAWVENHLSFPGRVTREEWVQQAKTLSAGGDTDFSKRVDKGDVDYS